MLGKNIAGVLFAFACTLQASAQNYLSPCVASCATQSLPEYGCAGMSDFGCVCSGTSSRDLAVECLNTNCPEEVATDGLDFDTACNAEVSLSLTYSTATTYTATSTPSTTSESSTSSTTESTSTSLYNTTSTTSSYTTSNLTTTSLSTSSYNISSSTTKPPTSTTAPAAVTSPVSTSAADRNALLPVAVVEIMAVAVAMAMF